MKALSKPVLSQRGSRWQAKIYMGRIDGVSKYDYAYGATAAEAEAAAYAKQKEQRPAEALQQASLTFKEWFEFYLSQHGAELKSQTVSKYKWTYERYIDVSLGKRKLKEIEPVHISVLLTKLVEMKLGATSRNHVITLIKQVLQQAKSLKLIASNPAEDIKRPSRKGSEKPILSGDDIRGFMEAFKGTWWEDHIILLSYTGMRRAELLGMRRKDVDLQAGVLRIEQHLVEFRDEYKIETPKTERSRRTIAIPTAVRDMLRRRLDTFDLAPDAPLFPNRFGEWQRPTSFSEAITRMSRKHKIPAWAHLFRHSHASLLLAGTGDLAQVSKRLGHANTQVTARIYSHALERIDHSLADASDRILGAASAPNLGALGADWVQSDEEAKQLIEEVQ